MPDTRKQHNKTAPNSSGQEAALDTPWRDGITGLHFGALWILVGLVSYLALTLLARGALHSPLALQQLQQEVPAHVYDRSLFVFGTAFLLDVLGLLFELRSSRLDVVLLPAFVKGVATLTNSLMRSGTATVAFSTTGRAVMVQRFVCWMHTTPTILVLVKMMATNITRQQAIHAVVCVEVMVVTGLAGALTAGWWAVFWGVISHLAFVPLLPYLHQGLKEASAVVSLHAARPTMTLVYYLTMLMWTGFGLVWDLRVFNLISTHTEEVAYLCCDFSAKVMFSAGLMLSSFKGLDCRREVVMRQIQETHKQTLILELKRAIEQKDAFMSSVSHELRTPLNGIIGISEGLLANCCGVLSESVRKQLFIVRTSGARLLALINDVMDAATLRQHRLVLKQERLELRQVVGDVVDLTRSLVGCDVSLRNDVPEGLEVWADSGRIIQILNNLLGNAAKFTHQGTIRVTARWHDEQRQWVAIHVIDTGIGIPKQKLQSIFLPFEQVDGSISRQYGGFGLGLCITQELVKAHGGELWVKSKEHKGSQFTFTIPSFTGQKPLTLQQKQQLQLQSRRSVRRSRTLGKLGPPDAVAAATAGAAGGSLLRCRSVSRGAALPLLAAPAAAGAAAGGEEGSSQPSSAAAATRRRRGSLLLLLGGGDDHTGMAPREQEGGAASPPAEDLLEGLVGEEYAKELPYDAAQLAALASSKPYTLTSPGGSSSNSGSMQRIPSNGLHASSSMLSLSAAADGVEGSPVLDITPVPNRDQRPNQFACTGRYQVLSVDDDPVNQTVVRSLLASTGYEVVCLYNGQQTLEYIENADVLPDLILLDMLMPDMSGPDVCRQLAKRQPPLGVPIILVSALSEEASVVQGLDSGADDYITKPFRRAEFLARIRGKLQLTGAGAARDQPSVQTPGSTGCEPVVMCITDDEVNHILLEGILQSQGYRYQKVSSGVEAIKLLAAAGNTPPHLVLLDAALPDMTGLDVLTTLRLQYSQVALPVIILTARHNEKAIVQALDAGANDYAVKPFRRAELLARIRMHLRSSQKAAAAVSPAVSPVAVHSAELSFAGDVDQQRMSVELLQRSLRLEQLSSVPLLVVQLDGVDEALASATAEETCQLMGFIADCFDALVEKYAVLKVDASDTCLTVAAPISISSCQNSARSSFQLPVLQLGSTPGNSTASLPGINHGPEATAAGVAAAQPPGDTQVGLLGALSAPLPSQPPAGGAAAAATQPADALTTALLQLQQMAQELHMWLGIDTPQSNAPSPSSSSPTLSASGRAEGSTNPTGGPTAPSTLQQQAAQRQQSPFVSDAVRLRARTPLQLLQPSGSQWWTGRVQPRTALHVGPLSAGVVGRRRPRYRLMGPALEVVRQACAQAPHGRTVATAGAAELLMASGVAGVRVLARPGNRGTSWEASCAGQKLWVVRTGEAAAMQSLMQLTDLSAAGEGRGGVPGAADGVLAQAVAALEGSAGIAAVHVPDLAPVVLGGSTPGGGPEQGSTNVFLAPPAPAVAASTSLGLLLAPTTTAPLAAAQQQQQQQQSLLCSGRLAAPGTEAPVSLQLDAHTMQSQQLLLQELALFAQQLAGLNGTTLPSSGNGSAHMCPVGLPGAVWGLQVPSSAGSRVGPWLPPVSLINSTCAPAGSAALQKPAAPSAPAAAAVGSSAGVDVMQAPWLQPAWDATCSSCPAPLAATQLLNGSSGWPLSSLSDAAQPFAATTAGLSGAGSCPNNTAAACGGWQLGATEVQQISLLHQELAALQLQLQTAMMTKGLSNGYGFSPQLPDNAAVPSAGPADTQQQMLDQQVQQQTSLQDQRQQQVPASSGVAQGAGGCAHVTVAPPPAPAAAVARHDTVLANGVVARGSISNSVKSDSGHSGVHSAGPAHQQQAAAPAVLSGRDRPRGQFLGQLFRRRSKKQKEQQGQQPPAKKA